MSQRKDDNVSTSMRYPIRLKQGVLKLANYLLLHDPGPRAAMKRAMVYSPNVGGHRHIYSKKIIDALKSLEFQVVFVYCGLQASGKRTFMPMKSPHLAALEEDADVLTVNIAERLTDETDELRLIIVACPHIMVQPE